ncbi:hypothetical protein Q1695_001595 [Nippostrongylus brasiliensis]|nr:hypothetical protein Q1695_001595 [Nippostrongylus brasiliensis]
MDSPSLSWSSAYSQPTERLRSAARMVGVQQPHFDQADSMTQTNFFPQFPIGSGFSFHELDYRLQEVTSAQHPVAVVEHSPCVPTAFTQPEGLQKYIPDVKPFTHYTARSLVDTDFSLFNQPMFQYPVPNIEVAQFGVKKNPKDEFTPYHTSSFQNFPTSAAAPVAQTFNLVRQSEKSCNNTQDCQVCHSTLANGLHFGARTCAACAAFFRRTISDGKKYVCKRSQRCNNPTKDATGYRKICRSCRLKRCMAIGMLPDNVQHKRCRRESPSSASTTVFTTMLQPFCSHISNSVVSNAPSSI